jgi:hypothetical protein
VNEHLERIVSGVMAANREFYSLHPDGTEPDRAFYLDFLEPFIEREMRQAKLDEVHLQTGGPVRKRESELVDSLRHWNRLCEERMNQ